MLVGGGLSDGERMASDIDVFVAPEQAVELTRAIAQLFGELGNRENRGLARMRYLVQELGPEGFGPSSHAQDEVQAPARRARRSRSATAATMSGSMPQRQEGLFYVGCCVPVGRMSGIELVEAARLAETYGDGEPEHRDRPELRSHWAFPRTASTIFWPSRCSRSTRRAPVLSSVASCRARGASSAGSPSWRRRSAP